jgi:hypothetical protein
MYISIYSYKKYLKELDENIIRHIKNNIDENFNNININTVTIFNNKQTTK